MTVYEPVFKMEFTKDERDALNMSRLEALEELPLEDIDYVELGLMKREHIIHFPEINNPELRSFGAGTINDPKLGSLNSQIPCGTCRQPSPYCPSHLGKITLKQNVNGQIKASPIVNPFYRRDVIRLLTIFCNSCGALLFTKEQIEELKKKKYQANKSRLKILEEYVKGKSKLIHTHRESTNLCDVDVPQGPIAPCVPNPKYILDKKSSPHIIEYEYEGHNVERTVEDIIKIFEQVTTEDAQLIGLGKNMPIDFIMYEVIVIPPKLRRASDKVEENNSDRMATDYIDIIKNNNNLIKGEQKKGTPLTSDQIS